MRPEQMPNEPDWSKYPVDLWGYAGMDRQRVVHCLMAPAKRTRIGHRQLYKAGFCRLAGGDSTTRRRYPDCTRAHRDLLGPARKEGDSRRRARRECACVRGYGAGRPACSHAG